MHDRASVVDGRAGVAAFCLLAAIGAGVYWPVFAIQPLDGDNLYILWWAHTAPVGALLRLDPQIYPEWRPLAFQMIWLEHRVVPLSAVAIHHAINLLALVSCAWLCYRIVSLLAQSILAGILMAIWLLVDQRSAMALILIVERQTLLACLFGLFAILLVIRVADRRLTTVQGATVAALLLASALSKEYGLCFPLAFMAYAGWQRRADIARPAAMGALLYALLRFSLIGGATASYCEDMGFFFRTQAVCLAPAAPSAGDLAQMVYNVAASATAIPLQGLINDEGMIALSRIRLATTSFLLLLAWAALRKGSRETRLFVLVVVANAALGFLVYRDRNLVPGTTAMAILTGIGLVRWQKGLGNVRSARLMGVVVLTLLIVAIGWQARQTRKLVGEEVSALLTEDPCASDILNRPGGLEFATLVKTTYRLTNPTCGRME